MNFRIKIKLAVGKKANDSFFLSWETFRPSSPVMFAGDKTVLNKK